MYKIGDIVKGIAPEYRELTEDKEYKVVGIREDIHKVIVINDEDIEKDYIWIRFGKVGD